MPDGLLLFLFVRRGACASLLAAQDRQATLTVAMGAAHCRGGLDPRGCPPLALCSRQSCKRHPAPLLGAWLQQRRWCGRPSRHGRGGTHVGAVPLHPPPPPSQPSCRYRQLQQTAGGAAAPPSPPPSSSPAALPATPIRPSQLATTSGHHKSRQLGTGIGGEVNVSPPFPAPPPAVIVGIENAQPEGVDKRLGHDPRWRTVGRRSRCHQAHHCGRVES